MKINRESIRFRDSDRIFQYPVQSPSYDFKFSSLIRQKYLKNKFAMPLNMYSVVESDMF